VHRIVLDTSILVAGLRSRRGASFRVLELVALREATALATTALLLEYEAVLRRPEQIAAHRLSDDELEILFQELAALLEPVEVHFRWRPQLADPGDELVLEAAANGRAEILVTHNVRDFEHAAPRFGIRVLTPGRFLQERG
jgi:putative PIN family toxin of toxin-antitoxin system